MITVEEAINQLYESSKGITYKASSYWTTAREFTASYQKIKFKQEFQIVPPKAEFIPSEIPQLVPPKGIKPLSPRS